MTAIEITGYPHLFGDIWTFRFERGTQRCNVLPMTGEPKKRIIEFFGPCRPIASEKELIDALTREQSDTNTFRILEPA
jgi:hypothetical protein